MRFSFKDIIKTVVIILGWLITILIIDLIIFFSFLNPDHPDFELFFIMTMFTINKHLLRKNGLGWDSLGFIPLKKKQLLNLVWQVPLCWFLIILVELIFLVVFYGDIRNLPDTENSAQIMEFTPFVFILVFFGLCHNYSHFRRNYF